MTSQDRPNSATKEQNHILRDHEFAGNDLVGSKGVDKTNRNSSENNNTVTAMSVEEFMERPTFISTKKVTWMHTKLENNINDGITIHTISGASGQEAGSNCEHSSSSFHCSGSKSDQCSEKFSEGVNLDVKALKLEDRSKERTSASRSLDEILDDSNMVGRKEVERTSECIPSTRPISLSISKEKIRLQSSSSTPTSPLKFYIDPVSPAVHQHLNLTASQTAAVDSSDKTATPQTSLTSTETQGSEVLRPMEPHFVVVAIDFGTTMSGYAFSFVRDPSSIHMMRKWEGGDPGVINQKTPTTLLLNPDGEFHSFGFTARDFYHDLDAKEAKRWLYFEKFKMALHYNAKLNKETTITASNGKPYSALKVFCHSLRYFKDHAIQELSDQSSTAILNEDIRWVITVPAIWKAPAKQFMRQAAYEAGIASVDRPNQLLIALEPEAASIYVRRLRVHQLLSSDSTAPSDSSSAPLSPSRWDDATSPFAASFSSSSSSSGPSFTPVAPKQSNGQSSAANDNARLSNGGQRSPDAQNRIEILQTNLRLFDSLPRQQTVGSEINEEGTRYMVVDCGGGTVDITVHEMEAKHGYLHELHKATGGPYGSVGVDLAFENLLTQIFGSEFIETFKTKRPAGWVDLMIAFESRKRAANPHKNNPLNISLPFSFIEYYKKTKGSPVETAINKHGDSTIRWSSQGMLRLSPEAMKRLFQSTLDHIKQAIGDVLNTIKDIKYLFLVGGFAESPILQHEIRHEFSHILKILIPQDVALTIMKGAVCFGLDPTVVTIRRSRLTYGVDVVNKFNPEKHPKSKLFRKDGYSWCTDVFDVFVTADQPMALGDTVVRKYAPAKTGQKTCNINIYSSEKSDVRFVTDPGVSKCGTVKLHLTDVADSGTSKIREIQAIMTFGDTEIKVDAIDVTTGTSVGATVDFLNK